MAFSLFGKSNVADMIIKGGRIYTQNPECPWVSAVACKDGKVLAVGDEDGMAAYQGKTTEVLDLQNHFMIPGLMDSTGTPVLDVFRQCSLFLEESMTVEQIVAFVADRLAKEQGEDTFFAYGYSSTLLKEIAPAEATALLDGLNATRPILLLSKDGYGAWINTIGLDLANEAAEEEGVAVLSLPFTISVLNPFSYEAIQKAVINQAFDYASKGYTGVFNSGSPDVFDNIYQNVLVAMDQEGLLPQRHYGSLSVLIPINPDFVGHKLLQNRTKCIELDELIHFNTLKLYLSPENQAGFTDEYLRAVCTTATERGFDVEIQVTGKDVLLACFKTLASLKIGGLGKSCFTVLHDETLTDAERYADLSPGEILDAPLSPPHVESNAQAIAALTTGSAEKLALLDKSGTIEPGKYADFAVYAQNPLEGTTLPKAVMTLLAGDIAFDQNEDHPDEWNRLVSQQNFDDESFLDE